MANKKKKKKNPNHQAPKKKVQPKAEVPRATEPAQAAAPKRKAEAPAQKSKRRPMPLSFAIGGIIVGLIAVVFLISWFTRDTSTGVLDRAAWDLPALDSNNDPDGDGRVKLADFAGKPVVMNFFASWCVNCERELPAFASAEERYGDQVQFVFVNSGETDDWKDMASEGGIRNSLLAKDVKGRNGNGMLLEFGGVGLPMTVFYDAQGNVVDIVSAELTGSQLDAQLAQMGVVAG